MSFIEAERVTIIGDIKGIRLNEISGFVKRTNSSYGGIYPNREQGLLDTEVVERTRALLTEAGVPDSLPITLCSSAEERVKRILQNLSSCRIPGGNGLYWIIDSNPVSLLAAIQSVTTPLHTDILRSTTIISFGLASDRVDPVTGIRIAILQRPFYQSPIHPTPAS